MSSSHTLLKNNFLRNKDRPVFTPQYDPERSILAERGTLLEKRTYQAEVYFDKPLKVSWPERLLFWALLGLNFVFWYYALQFLGVL